MTAADIQAIRDALAAGPGDTTAFFGYLEAVHPERIARLLAALEDAEKRDAEARALLRRALEVLPDYMNVLDVDIQSWLRGAL